MSTGLHGTGSLFRAFLHLDRFRLLPWVGVIGLFPLLAFQGYAAVFATPADAAVLAASLQSNPSFSLLFGPADDLSTAEGFTVWRVQILALFFIALMAVFTVVRHTRAAEDTGQAELLDASAVGPHARLAAAVLLAWAASALTGVVIAGTLTAAGSDVKPALLLAGMIAAHGMVFAGVAAVTAQLGSFARTASTLAVAFLGISYVLRGVGDTVADAGWLLWTNPMGWAEQVRPVTDANAAPLGLLAGVALLLAALGAALQARRDFGLGLIAAKPGPAGSRFGQWGLALRLNRGPIISWTVALAVLGAIYGLVVSSFGDLFAENEFIGSIIASRAGGEEELTFTFVRVVLMLMAMIASVPGMQLALRAVAEEHQGRAEWLLSGSLTRFAHLLPTAVLALVLSSGVLLLGSLTLAGTANAAGAAIDVGRVVRQAGAGLPAVVLVVALALAFAGAEPRLRGLAWAALSYWLVLTMFGPLLNAPDWMLATSPFHHVPNLGDTEPDWGPILWVAAVAAVLAAVAFIGYRRRDVQTP